MDKNTPDQESMLGSLRCDLERQPDGNSPQFQGLHTPLKVRSRHIRTIVVSVVKSAEPNCVAVIGANVLSVDINAQLYHHIQ